MRKIIFKRSYNTFFFLFLILIISYLFIFFLEHVPLTNTEFYLDNIFLYFYISVTIFIIILIFLLSTHCIIICDDNIIKKTFLSRKIIYFNEISNIIIEKYNKKIGIRIISDNTIIQITDYNNMKCIYNLIYERKPDNLFMDSI
jgi:hypothetical protein